MTKYVATSLGRDFAEFNPCKARDNAKRGTINAANEDTYFTLNLTITMTKIFPDLNFKDKRSRPCGRWWPALLALEREGPLNVNATRWINPLEMKRIRSFFSLFRPPPFHELGGMTKAQLGRRLFNSSSFEMGTEERRTEKKYIFCNGIPLCLNPTAELFPMW